MRKFTTIKQSGEMSWGQPRYGIVPTDEELARVGPKGRIVLETRHYDHTTVCRETGETSSHTSVSEYVAYYNRDAHEIMCDINSYHDVAILANYFGDRMDSCFYGRYSKILVELS